MPIFSCHLKIICHILASKYKIQVDPWTTWGQRLSTPCTVENLFNFWLPKNLTTVIPWCPWEIGSRNPPRYQNPRMLKSLMQNGAEQCIQSALIKRRFPTMDWKYVRIYQGCLIYKKYFICGLKIPQTH